VKKVIASFLLGALVLALNSEEAGFTLRTRGAQLGTILSTIATASDYILVMEKGVDPSIPVNVDVSEATLDEVLTAVLAPHGYSYEISGKFLKVKALETRVFTLNFVPTKLTAESRIGGNVLGGLAGGAGGGGATAGGAAGAGAGGGQISGSFTLQSTIPESDLWEQISKTLEGLLSSEGKITVDRMSGTVIVTDYRTSLERMEAWLKELENILRKQISLEVKVAEVTLDKSSSFGIDFSRLFGPSSGNAQVTFKQQLAPGEGTSLTLNTIHFPTDPAQGLSNVLRALQTQGNVNVLASPRLSVINGQTALVTMGDVTPFISNITQTITGISGFPTISITVSQVQAGILLGLTPKVAEDDTVVLHVVPLVTDILGFEDFGTVQSVKITAPKLSSRGTSTIVRVKSGDTIVIAGLLQSRDTKSTKKTPLLGDIPGIGLLFQQKTRITQKKEIIIFITPSVQIL